MKQPCKMTNNRILEPDPTWRAREDQNRIPGEWVETPVDTAEMALMNEDEIQAAFRNITLEDLKRSKRWDRMWDTWLTEKGVRLRAYRATSRQKVNGMLNKIKEMGNELC